MKSPLTKPVIFLKVQTTGLNSTKDRIVEISITKYSNEANPITNTRLVNPTIAIPEEATSLHGITDAMVAEEKTFASFAQKLADFIGNSDIAGFAVKNDVKFLAEEFNKANVKFELKNRKIIDLYEIYTKVSPRNIYSAIQDFTGSEVPVTRRFSSEEYNRASTAILDGMIDKLSGIPILSPNSSEAPIFGASLDAIYDGFSDARNNLDSTGRIKLNKAGRPIFSFGKFKGQIVSEVLLENQKYYNWLIDTSDLPEDAKSIISKIYRKAKEALEA